MASLILSHTDSHKLELSKTGAAKIWNYQESVEPVSKRRAANEDDMRRDIETILYVVVALALGITLLVLFEIRNVSTDPPWEEVICAGVLGYVAGRWHSRSR